MKNILFVVGWVILAAFIGTYVDDIWLYGYGYAAGTIGTLITVYLIEREKKND